MKFYFGNDNESMIKNKKKDKGGQDDEKQDMQKMQRKALS